MLSDLEEFQHAQITLHLNRGQQGVASNPERTRRQRKRTAVVSIEASQGIDGPAAPNYQYRSDLKVAEEFRSNCGGLFGLVFVSERKIESPAEHESMPLIVGRQCVFGADQVRVFRLLIKVGSVINSFGYRVAARKLDLPRESSIHG